jgi:queuine tRNA-ribosyltransferase
MLGARLNTLHNLHYYQELLKGLREAVRTGRLESYIAAFEVARNEDEAYGKRFAHP